MYCVRCGDRIEKDELICDKCGLHFTVMDEKGNVLVYINQSPNPINPAQETVEPAKPMPNQAAQPVNQQMAGTAGQQPAQLVNQNMAGAVSQQAVQPVNQQNQQNNGNVTGMAPVQASGPVNNAPQPAQAMQPKGGVQPAQAMQPQGTVQPAQAGAPMQQPRGNVHPAQPMQPQGGVQPQPMAAQAVPASKKKGKVKGEKKKKKFRYGWIIALATVASIFLVTVFSVITLVVGVVIGVAVLADDGSEVVVNDPSQTGSTAPSTPVTTFENEYISEQSDYFSTAIRDRFVTPKGDGTDTVTVMIYMNGSDLESKYGYATDDLEEMLNAKLSDNVNVVIQTGGTKKWETAGISPKHSQRFIVKDGQLVLVDDTLDQLDITRGDTLEDFIRFASTNYPADRNILIFWNHGGGAVYGYGSDEIVNDYYASLTIGEIKDAIQKTNVKFEMIGFDACLMGGLETACVLYDVADYLVASEDFEPGTGWEYQNWLSLLGYNSSTPMTDVGKVIVDDYIKETINSEGEGILALVDLRYTRLLYSSWIDFAYANESELLSYDYTMSMQRSERANDKIFRTDAKKDIFDWLFPTTTMETYCYAVDIMALASTMKTDEANALRTVMKSAVLYCSSTGGDSYMTGLSVTLPYGDTEFYDELREVFIECGLDSTYIEFLSGFAYASDLSSYDWEGSDFTGWDYYDSEYEGGEWNDYNWDDYDWDSYYSEDYDWDCYDYGDDWYYDDGYYDDWYYDDGYYDDSYGYDYYDDYNYEY